MMSKRGIGRILMIVLAGSATLAICAVPYTGFYRNARFARMSLDEQLRTQERHINDPLFLYHLGCKLNARQRFGEAALALERSVGLDPDAAAARDEWARALLGSGQV